MATEPTDAYGRPLEHPLDPGEPGGRMFGYRSGFQWGGWMWNNRTCPLSGGPCDRANECARKRDCRHVALTTRLGRPAKR
jgi:hypothetical protein